MFWLKKRKNRTPTPPWDSGYFHIDENTKTDWENLTSEKLIYTIEESRLHLQNIFDSSNSLAQKASFFVVMICGAITFMFMKYVSQYQEYSFTDWYLWPIAGYFIVLCLAFIRLVKYVMPSLDYDAIGTPPEILLRKKGMMDFDFKKMIVSQLEFYQGRIYQNMKQNKLMAYYIKRWIIYLISYPVIVSALLFVTFVLSF